MSNELCPYCGTNHAGGTHASECAMWEELRKLRVQLEQITEERDDYRDSSMSELEACQQANADNARLLAENRWLREFIEDTVRRVCQGDINGTLQEDAGAVLNNARFTAAEMHRVRQLETIIKRLALWSPFHMVGMCQCFFCHKPEPTHAPDCIWLQVQNAAGRVWEVIDDRA